MGVFHAMLFYNFLSYPFLYCDWWNTSWLFNCILVAWIVDLKVLTWWFVCCIQLTETLRPPPPPPTGDFAIGQEQLALLSRNHDVLTLEQYGGASFPSNYLSFIWFMYYLYTVCIIFNVLYTSLPLHQVNGLSNLLKTNLEKGIQGDEPDLLKRSAAFGSNKIPPKKGRSFWVNFIANLIVYNTFFLLLVLSFPWLKMGVWTTLFTYSFLLLFILDVSLGILARPHTDNIDDSCSGLFGSGYKDWGELGQGTWYLMPSGSSIPVD